MPDRARLATLTCAVAALAACSTPDAVATPPPSPSPPPASAAPSRWTPPSTSYAEGGGAANRVPNADFARGLDRWGTWGSGVTSIASDRGGGRMLHVSATSAQIVGLNSASFPATAGASYSATFATRVSPMSAGSGYFTVIFLATTETSRVTVRVDPEGIPLGSGMTNASGAFTIADADRSSGKLLVEATYVGSDRYWPAYAQQTIP